MNKLVITSAQNSTKVFRKGLKTLHNFCKINNAELVVIPFVGKRSNDHIWSHHVTEYLQSKNVKLNKNVLLGAEVPINFQSSDPVSGMDNVSGSSSLIVAGTRHRLKVVPVQKNSLPKVLMSAPCITMPNYHSSFSGWKSNNRHQYGAIYIEYNSSGKYHFRQLTINPTNGYMFDMNKLYTPNDFSEFRPLALVMGDTHIPNQDQSVFDAKFKGGGLIDTLQPESLVWHDILDFSAASHHIKGNHERFYKSLTSKDVVETELKQVCDILWDIEQNYDMQQYIISSNHNDHLTKWLDGEVPKDKNALLWYHLNYLNCIEKVANCGRSNPLEIYYNLYDDYESTKVNFLNVDDSLMVGEFELGMHGHFGANGAKGSIKSFNNMGIPSVTGHTHTPQIYNGNYCVGTNSKLDMGYNLGLSSWLQSDCIIYPYGATLINYIDGEYCF